MWDERYSAPGYAYGVEPNDFLRSVTARIPDGGHVLCLAEGEGRNAVYLAGQGHRVMAVDASPVGLAKAEKLASERAVEIETVAANLADFVIEPDAWDAIVSIFCHLPPPLRARVHGAAVRGLRAGGVFVLEGFTERQLDLGTGGPPSAELMMSLDALRGELDGLELVVARETEREIREGRFHDGRSAVVQVVGVRHDAS
jgi:SAM-dependent methyltransferase